MALGALGVFGTCVAYLLSFYLIRAWDPTRATTVLYVVPIVGLLLGLAVLGQALDAWRLGGAALIVGGVALTHARRLSRGRLGGVLEARGREMDFNEYTTVMLIRERHAEMVEAARCAALLQSLATPRRPLRAALGTALIRLGAWLLREQYPAAAAR